MSAIKKLEFRVPVRQPSQSSITESQHFISSTTNTDIHSATSLIDVERILAYLLKV